ncbi:hypothetical protein [Bacillus sp. FDAARGOS_1420]|uniref:hypothetical protein n=1 Tax=Bacillus sp. FDAARGOS_1420 TaxID=2856338 RepID=UPI00214C8E09|nr:hypothetical protein [Bacillus sp. FDAARGOS_1420]
MCRQSVSTYIQMFNSNGIENLLERRYPPGRTPYLSSYEICKILNVHFNRHPLYM